VRFRAQVELADCGAASLAMVLELHGKPVPFDEVRTVCGTGRDGTDALTLIEAARYYGLDARGVRTEVEDLEALPAGTMLFWDLSHFVVLDRVRRNAIEIVDPALGRRIVRMDEVRQSYSGVALLLEPGSEFVAGGRRKHGMWRHVRPLLEQRTALRRAVTTSLLIRVLALGLPLLTAALVDRVVPTNDRGLLAVIALSLVFVVGFHFLTSWLRSLLLLELRTRVDLRTTLGFLEHLVALPYTFHLNRSSGDLMMRLRSNSVVRELLTTTTLSALLDGAFATLYLGLLVALSPPLGLLVLGLGALQVVVLLLSRRATQRLASEGLRAEARSQGYAFQLLAGIGTLKSSGTEARAVDEFSRLFTDELDVALRRGRLSALVDSLTGALTIGSPLVVLAVAGMLVLNGSVSLGTALAVNALAAGFLGPLATLVTTGLSIQVLTSYVERLNDVFDAPREQEGEEVAPAPALSGALRAEGVSFRYAPLSPTVVDDVSVEVASGQTIALVGRSGSGKTTLGHLLLGLYRPHAVRRRDAGPVPVRDVAARQHRVRRPVHVPGRREGGGADGLRRRGHRADAAVVRHRPLGRGRVAVRRAAAARRARAGARVAAQGAAAGRGDQPPRRRDRGGRPPQPHRARLHDGRRRPPALDRRARGRDPRRGTRPGRRARHPRGPAEAQGRVPRAGHRPALRARRTGPENTAGTPAEAGAPEGGEEVLAGQRLRAVPRGDAGVDLAGAVQARGLRRGPADDAVQLGAGQLDEGLLAQVELAHGERFPFLREGWR
jgi:ABC-type bacteriocin/lantibiotic exporter with double-glycine peptidase domain